MKSAPTNDSQAQAFTCRSFLETAVGACAITPIARLSLQLGGSGSGSLTKEQRVFDAGIGHTFNGRVAGNVANDDLLGSMEFACAVSGAKLVLVLGHTACGAVKGAIDDVVLGNLTGLLARIKPAIPETNFEGEKSSKSPAYVDAG